MPTKPPAEVDLTEDLVRDLLAGQHPDLAVLPVRLVAQGWDNGMFRLGDDLAVRLPRRQMGVAPARNEQRWLSTLAALCPVPVPAPVRLGAPSGRFPWSWSVVPWFTGTVAASQPVPDRRAWAGALADALAALHVPAPADAPVNPVRGGPLADRSAALDERIAAGYLDTVLLGDPASGRHVRDAARRLWDDALTAPTWSGPPLWLHGDPHPANLLVDGGTLAALLDFGDMTAGDPACDLATAWLTFDAAGRAEFRTRTEAAGAGSAGAAAPGTVVPGSAAADPGLWRRAAGWALVMCSAMVTHSEDDPTIGAIGTHAAQELLG